MLFADLKGSLELIADRDPEEARKLLDPVVEHMCEAVEKYGGTVSQVMGDGILALFGAPVSWEDHAVRACYAALSMQDLVRHYGDDIQRVYGVPVQIRIGLNSGEVVLNVSGRGLYMSYIAVGQHGAHRGADGADGEAGLGARDSGDRPPRRGLHRGAHDRAGQRQGHRAAGRGCRDQPRVDARGRASTARRCAR